MLHNQNNLALTLNTKILTWRWAFNVNYIAHTATSIDGTDGKYRSTQYSFVLILGDIVHFQRLGCKISYLERRYNKLVNTSCYTVPSV
jgi:hypothetical protein